MARPEKKISPLESGAAYRGLRDWLERVDRMGELLKIDGADWDREMGATTQLLTQKKGVKSALGSSL